MEDVWVVVLCSGNSLRTLDVSLTLDGARERADKLRLEPLTWKKFAGGLISNEFVKPDGVEAVFWIRKLALTHE